jgi:hypothetical protein
MITSKLPRRVAAVFGLLCALAFVAPVAAAASPSSATSWSLAPSTAKGADGRTHFSYSNIKPGTVIHDYVGITNFSDRPVTFRVYPSDGVTTTAGSLGLAVATAKPVDIGAWLHLEHGTVTVPPKRELNEPVTLTVPANATPGDHAGGVIASITEAAKGGRVSREDRVGVAVYLRVAGPLHPVLGVESMSVSGYHGTVNPFGGGGTTVSYTVHNTGNIRLSGTQTVTVTGPFGVTLATVHPAALEQVMPGGTVRVRATLTGIFPAGPLTVRVNVTPAEVPGTVHVQVPLVGGTGSASMWATPWPQLALLAVLVAVAFGVRWFLRGRRRDHDAALRAAVERGRREAAEQLAAVAADPE